MRDETTNQEPNHEWAKSELIKAQVELGTLEAHGQATRVQVAGYREVAQRLGGNALRQGDLLGELKAAEEKYLLYVNKREEARIEDALDQGGILNVTIAEEPRVPALPARAGWVFGLDRRVAGRHSEHKPGVRCRLPEPGFRTPDEVRRVSGHTGSGVTALREMNQADETSMSTRPDLLEHALAGDIFDMELSEPQTSTCARVDRVESRPLWRRTDPQPGAAGISSRLAEAGPASGFLRG